MVAAEIPEMKLQMPQDSSVLRVAGTVTISYKMPVTMKGLSDNTEGELQALREEDENRQKCGR